MSDFSLYFDERCLWHTSATMYAGTFPVGGWVQPTTSAVHVESPEVKRRIKSLLDVSGLTKQIQVRTAAPASDEQLLRVHDYTYLEKFKHVSDTGGGELGNEASCGPGSYEIARLAAGLVTQAISDVLEGQVRSGYALVRPPSHHSSRSTPMGFCFLNNVAIGIEDALATGKATRIAVLDWDVHHGNGTQEIFYERSDVLTISVHQDKCFPPGYTGTEDRGSGPGYGTNLNVALFPGGGHREYLAAMDVLVLPALQKFNPDIIIIACGLDANGLDPLARMLATSNTFREMSKRVLSLNRPVVAVHEGGYSESYVPFCALAVIEELSGIHTPCEDPSLDFINRQQPNEKFYNFQLNALHQQAKQLGFAN
ncbi:MAG: class II histone deacetylase [Mycobacteriaceae bacterium]